jgi:hypothetical protein
MLRWLILRNFKAFAGEHRIRLAPLTLIFGKNSAGKSSIIQSILFLKQSAPSLLGRGEAKWVGDDVDLGSMEHALYGQGRDPNHEKLTVGAISTLTLESENGVMTEYKRIWYISDDRGPIREFQTWAARNTTTHTIGTEFSWNIRETSSDDSDKPALAQWGIYNDEETYPIIRSTGPIWDSSEPRPIRKSEPVPPNVEHPKIAAIYGAISSPLAAAFRSNLEAWAEIVGASVRRPELRALVEPMVRYWRLAEGLSDLKDLRWLDPRLVEPDLKRRVPRARARQSTTSFDPSLLVPRFASWLPNAVPDVDWSILRTRATGAAEDYLRTLPVTERRTLRRSLGGFIEEALMIQKNYELVSITSPQSKYGVFNELEEGWEEFITDEDHPIHAPAIRKIIASTVISYSGGIGRSTGIVAEHDIMMLKQDFISAGKSLTSLRVQELFHEARFFLRAARGTKWKRGDSDISLSDHILDHADQFHAIGIPDNASGFKWYEPGELEYLANLESNTSDLAVLQLKGPLSRITHVKGLRPQLRRTYEALTSTPDPGASDRDPTRALATRLNGDRPLLNRINIILRDIGLPYTLEIQDGSNRVFPIKYHAFYLRDTRNLALVGIQDVGFGIGQLIPVAAELANLRGELLLMEQPELHLHPAMQANLGELLANTVKDHPASQLIVETHSEHVVLRLMRLVREGKIDHELVQILYVDQDEEGKSYVTELPLDKYGEFTVDWPNGFFDERLNEL